ncbi:hypothetical protein GQX73_g5954 [Xylaria multiplex]|uniref:Extracellular membrane protein CFEM domain-containing protein n=1 Tax=Xylaria multiplex TaxID=323545 RepID=A0A7C8N6B4_9PEZI|nr:hypothetical protein GQX73_g5954 [Xylaria multiplex]
MKATIVSIAVLAAAVSADTTTASTTTTACAAQTILDACLDTTEGYLTLCGSQDYSCLCDKYTAIMTCFANCPNDDRQYALDSQRQLYCANASAFSTKTTSSKSLAKSTGASATTTGSASSDPTNGATSTFGNADATSSTATSTPNAADSMDVAQHGSGLLVAFAGVVAAALL